MIANVQKFNAKKIIFPILAFLFPFFFALQGIDWSYTMHPDELHMATTIDAFSGKDFAKEASQYDKRCIYPEGYFLFTGIYHRLVCLSEFISHKSRQEGERNRNLDYIRAPIHRTTICFVALGRHTNVLLAGLTGLFIFFAVLVATGSAIGGVCASALVACSPFVIEHAHYCESDVSFCVMLAVALWALFYAICARNVEWTIAGAAASAAAFACKYTAAPIIPFCVLVFTALCYRRLADSKPREERKAELRRCALIALCCLVAAIAAYALFTPVFWANPKLYWSKIFKVYNASHTETDTRYISRSLDAVPFLHLRFMLRLFATHFRDLGVAHLALASGSAVFLLFRRRQNPCGAWLLMLFPLFFIFDVAVMPWLRSQEFLPFVVLTGATIAIAIGEICSIAVTSKARFVRVSIPSLCIAASLALTLGGARRASNMFLTEDSRDTMRHWLEQSSNPDTRFAAGRFAFQAVKYGRINTAKIFDEAEILWHPSAESKLREHEYYVRQTAFSGRAFISEITGERHPKYQAGWTNFLANAILLREWKHLPGYQTTFSQMPMELWGIIPKGAAFALPAPLAPRATAYRMGPEHYDAAQGGDWLGAIDAIRTVGARKRVRFVPPRDGRPLYAVTRHVGGSIPAKIKWEGCFAPREKTIEPRRADWFAYKPSPLDGFGNIYVRTRVRMRGDDQTSLCLTTITADPAFAAELLTRGGSPDKAAELLAAAGLPTDLDAAIAQAVEPLPESFYTDFARVRFGDFTVYPGPEFNIDEAASSDSPVSVKLESEFPVMFDPGRYRISFRLPRQESGAPELKSIFFTGAVEQHTLSGVDFSPDQEVTMELVFDMPTNPRICGAATTLGKHFPAFTLENFSIDWEPLPAQQEVKVQ